MNYFFNRIPLFWKFTFFLLVSPLILVFFLNNVAKIATGGPISIFDGVAITFLLLSLMALYLFAIRWIKKTIKAINGVKCLTKALAAGKTSVALSLKVEDEFREIESSLNKIIERTIQTSEFTIQIKSNVESTNFTPLGPDDHLGYNLLELKRTLSSHQEVEGIRKWSSEAHSKCIEILRSQENIKALANEVVKYIVNTVKASHGAVFLLETDPNGDYLDLKGCYAYNRIKYHSLQILPGEGLVGQTFLEKEKTYIKKVPDDYIKIKSGLGEANPKALLILPLKIEEEVLGVMELASFEEFQAHEIEFLEAISESIAHSIASIQVAERTKKLLDDSIAQAEQLKAQEEELRQNQEELQATQEEISRKYDNLFNNLRELNYQSKFEQLKAINSAKKRNVEYYFDIIRNQILTFSENKMVVDAVKEFKMSFLKITDTFAEEALSDIKLSVKKYYEQEFISKLNDNSDCSSTEEELLPPDLNTLVLQYLYISNNPHPTGHKALQHHAGDTSEYSKVHSIYHPLMKNFLEKFGYYDIFLIDSDTGDMLYSVFKEVDFATNLVTGAYSETNFGMAVKEAITSKEKEYVKLVDFEPYTPSYEAPASFIACPIYDDDNKIGVLVFQMPINKINQILTGDNNWKEDGLGDSGETVIVGGDSRLRSISRKLIERKDDYYACLQKMGYSLDTIHKIRKSNTSILLEEMNTPFIKRAVNGEADTHLGENHLGIASLTAFAPLQITDVNWAIVSTMYEEEASAVINNLKNI